MPAITPALMTALRKVLEERFVPLLPPLQGNHKLEDNQQKQLSRAFNAFVLQKMFDLSATEAADCVVDDFADNGIDGIYYKADEEILYLLQSKLKNSEDFKQGEAQSFEHGVRLLVEQNLDDFNQRVKDKADDIDHALDHCSHIKLIVAYTGSGATQTAVTVLEQFVNDDALDEERVSPEIIYVDAQKIESWLRQENAIGLVNTRIKLSHSSTIGEPRKTVIGLAKIDDLVKLHNEHDKALYQKNIRYFIGAGRRGVNQAIKQTLEKSSKDFHLLNNGITAVCTFIEPKKSKGGYKDYVVAGLSVVNGAQTISSAAQCKQENPDLDTSSAKVMMTVILTSSHGDFHKIVTKARNLQNPVDLSNFAALDDTQERLRQEMALYGYDYHYRPQQPASGDAPVIEISSVAKALACLDKSVDWPGRLKSEPSVFTNPDSDIYQSIFTADLTGLKAINAVTVFNVIHDLLAAADRGSPSPERLVYRHCLYPLASVLVKQFKDQIEGAEVLKDADIRAAISGPFDALRQAFADACGPVAHGSMHYAFFKRIGDTAKIAQSAMIKYLGLSEDETAAHLSGALKPDDPYNQNLSNFLFSKLSQIGNLG